MAGRSILLWLLVPGLLAAEPAANWSADYPPCNHRSDLLRPGPLSLGVRFNTTNPVLAQQFRRAMDFWATVLELQWPPSREFMLLLYLFDVILILALAYPVLRLFAWKRARRSQ